MFGRSDKDVAKSLTAMEQWARETANFNQSEAKRLLIGAIKQDARFQGYNADEVARRVQESRQTGAMLDLTDDAPSMLGGSRPI